MLLIEQAFALYLTFFNKTLLYGKTGNNSKRKAKGLFVRE